VSASPLVIGTAAARSLSEALGAEFSEVPAVEFGPSWSDGPAVEEWRNDLAAGSPAADLVVAIWPSTPQAAPVVGQGLAHWVETMEEPFALWFAALSAAAERCADNGQVVAVVDRPDPKSAAGWGAQAAVADAVEVMGRSLSLIHEGRNVRVNTVTTPARLTGLPGDQAGADLVATVAMLLSQSVVGMNASAVHLGGDL
jgi:hypothetical protein